MDKTVLRSPFQKIAKEIKHELDKISDSVEQTHWLNFQKLNRQQKTLEYIKSKVVNVIETLSCHGDHQKSLLFYWYLAEIGTLSNYIDEKNIIVKAFREGRLFGRRR